MEARTTTTISTRARRVRDAFSLNSWTGRETIRVRSPAVPPGPKAADRARCSFEEWAVRALYKAASAYENGPRSIGAA
jgi:hypothetical protein